MIDSLCYNGSTGRVRITHFLCDVLHRDVLSMSYLNY
jgi:hypothetical protein